jgi:pimeloyl-ACP methyl ester carboxylesterase
VLRTWRRDLAELESMLPRIEHIQTLLIWGSRDKAVSSASAGALQRQFANCQAIVFDGVGHLPYEEVPDQFNRAVVEFLYGSPT